MWVPTADLPKSAGHPFYERLNRVLDDAGFDAFVEAQCASFYADGVGRPSLAPGRYFRLLLLGYFEGLDSERAIAWRAADSLSIRTFLDFALHEAPPDHSTLSRTRRLIDLETHQAVFTWVLQRLADATLVVGRTVGIDATTLEANAAMRSIVRRDTGESYDAFLTRLAEASGLSTPTRAELARFDRTRKKKGSNDDWTHPHDPDAKITKMKDGRTHLAHTAEHAVDLETGAIVGVTVQDASAGDTTTLVDTLVTAAEQVAFGPVAGWGTDRNPVAVCRESGDFAPERDCVQADGFEQRAVQRRAQRHDHRTAEHLGRRQLDALQNRSVHAAQFALRRGKGACQNDIRDAQPAERCDGVRRHARFHHGLLARAPSPRARTAERSSPPAAERSRPTVHRCPRRRSGPCVSWWPHSYLQRRQLTAGHGMSHRHSSHRCHQPGVGESSMTAGGEVLIDR